MGEAVRRTAATNRSWPRVAALAVAFGLLAPPAQPQDLHVTIDRGRFRIVAEQRDSSLAAHLLAQSVAADSFPGLPRPRDSVLIQIAPNAQAFRELAGPGAPKWGAAFAFSRERRVVLQGSWASSAAGDPTRVLRHELAHLALHEYLGDRPPRWFDEGYASWSAREWGRESVIAANIGLAFGPYRGLASLDSAFDRGAASSDAAYALAFRAVAELDELDRSGGLARLFEYWKDGDLEQALRRSFGMTYDAFERHWQRRTRRRYGALALATNVTLGALVLLMVISPLYLLRRQRDRRRLEAMRVAEAAAEAKERAEALAQLLGEVGGVREPRDEEPPSSS